MRLILHNARILTPTGALVPEQARVLSSVERNELSTRRGEEPKTKNQVLDVEREFGAAGPEERALQPKESEASDEASPDEDEASPGVREYAWLVAETRGEACGAARVVRVGSGPLPAQLAAEVDRAGSDGQTCVRSGVTYGGGQQEAGEETSSRGGILKLVSSSKEKTLVALDCGGRVVLPGLHDSHCHVYALGKLREKGVVLQGCGSVAEMQARLRAKLDSSSYEGSGHAGGYEASSVHVGGYEASSVHASSCDEGLSRASPYLEGLQWDQDELGRLPTKEDLDAVSTEVPIVCFRRCWHIAVCNSCALRLCGVDVEAALARRADGPDGGDVDLRPASAEVSKNCGAAKLAPGGVDNCSAAKISGVNNLWELTGVVRENAMKLLTPVLSREEPFAEKQRLLLLGLQEFAANGVTAVHTNDSVEAGGIRDAWAAYWACVAGRAGNLPAAQPPLPCRVFLTIGMDDPIFADGESSSKSSTSGKSRSNLSRSNLSSSKSSSKTVSEEDATLAAEEAMPRELSRAPAPTKLWPCSDEFRGGRALAAARAATTAKATRRTRRTHSLGLGARRARGRVPELRSRQIVRGRRARQRHRGAERAVLRSGGRARRRRLEGEFRADDDDARRAAAQFRARARAGLPGGDARDRRPRL